MRRNILLTLSLILVSLLSANVKAQDDETTFQEPPADAPFDSRTDDQFAELREFLASVPRTSEYSKEELAEQAKMDVDSEFKKMNEQIDALLKNHDEAEEDMNHKLYPALLETEKVSPEEQQYIIENNLPDPRLFFLEMENERLRRLAIKRSKEPMPEFPQGGMTTINGDPFSPTALDEKGNPIVEAPQVEADPAVVLERPFNNIGNEPSKLVPEEPVVNKGYRAPGSSSTDEDEKDFANGEEDEKDEL